MDDVIKVVEKFYTELNDDQSDQEDREVESEMRGLQDLNITTNEIKKAFKGMSRHKDG